MTLSAGEPTRSWPGVLTSGTECEPDPTPNQLADDAESAARFAVEGVGISANPDRNRHPRTSAGAGLSHSRCARPGTP